MVNIAVLVSGGGTNLQALLDAREQNPCGRITLVVSSREGVYALERAKSCGIPALTLPRKGFENAAAFDQALLTALERYEIGLVVLAGFLCILGKPVVDRYRDRIVNVHPSLIPSFCGDGFYGLRVHEAALAYGVKVTGATVHLVNEVTDGGRILLQKAVEVREDDTPEALQRRVMEQAEWDLLPRAVAMLCNEITQDGRRTVSV